MKRLTQKDKGGNWSLKGLSWESIHEGKRITKEVWEKLYGALWKLMEYEETGLTPEDVERVNDFVKSRAGHLLKELNKEQAKHRWIPVEERLPENSDYILLNFANFSLAMIGRYEKSEDGSGAFYLGDCDEDDTCVANGLFVNAWMPLPEPYKVK